MSGEGELFRSAMRAALGLREPDGTTPGDTPELWRLGEYKATVRAAASDGSTVDVEPEDARLPKMQAVPLRQPFPGCTIVPTAGSVLRIGWEAGREDRPYAGIWESGSASKIIIPGTTVFLGAESGAQFVALANLVLDELNKIQTAHNTHVHVITGTVPIVGAAGSTAITATAAAPVVTYTSSSVAASQVKAK